MRNALGVGGAWRFDRGIGNGCDLQVAPTWKLAFGTQGFQGSTKLVFPRSRSRSPGEQGAFLFKTLDDVFI